MSQRVVALLAVLVASVEIGAIVFAVLNIGDILAFLRTVPVLGAILDATNAFPPFGLIVTVGVVIAIANAALFGLAIVVSLVAYPFRQRLGIE